MGYMLIGIWLRFRLYRVNILLLLGCLATGYRLIQAMARERGGGGDIVGNF